MKNAEINLYYLDSTFHQVVIVECSAGRRLQREALGEDPAAKTLAKLCLGNVFATSNRRSICFQSEEAEETPAESVQL